jgi:hypothetical protein
MAEIAQQITMSGIPGDVVWRRVIDFERMPEWFVGVRRITTGGRELGLGMERIVTLWTGQSFRESVVEWVPGRKFTYHVHNPPRFMSDWQASVTVEPTSAGDVAVNYRIRYQMKYGAVGRFVDTGGVSLVMRTVLALSMGKLKKLLERR